MTTKTKPRIDIAASLPGPAEALVPVVKTLGKYFQCRVIGYDKKQSDYDTGGSLSVWRTHLHDPADVIALEQHIDRQTCFSNNPPDLLLLGAVNDLTGRRRFPEEDLIADARRHDIPTIQFIDNWFAWSATAASPDWFFTVDADCRAVGEAFHPRMKNYFTCGHPGLQHLLNAHQPPAGPVKNDLIYFTQPGADSARTLNWLGEILTAGDRLLIKKHPRDDADLTHVLARFDRRMHLTADPPEVLFHRARQVITHTSVVGLKAILLGIPTIHVCPQAIMGATHDLLGGYPLAQAGFSREANSPGELKQALAGPLYPDTAKLAQRFYIHSATQRAVAKIKNLIHDKETQ